MITDHVQIFDTTLRDGEQSPGASLNIEEKIEIARQLERLGVDVIEAGFPISSPGDFEAVRRIASAVGDSVVVCGLTRAVPKDIDVAWDALKGATASAHPYGPGCQRKPPALQAEKDSAKKRWRSAWRRSSMPARWAARILNTLPKTAGGPTREYLYRVIEAVIKAGATVINVPDTTGYMSPDEYGALFAGIINHVPGIENVMLSAHCHNDLGMATANALAAVKNGARQIECTVNGIGERAGNTCLEEVVMALHTRARCLRNPVTRRTRRDLQDFAHGVHA